MESNRKLALGTTLVFAGFSLGWVYGTDQLLSLFSLSKDEISALSIYKSYFCIAIVSAFLYLILRALVKRQCNRCRTFFETANDAIFVYDPGSGKIIDLNSRTCEMFGYSHDEFTGRNSATENPEVGPFTYNDVALWIRKTAGGRPQHFEWRTRHKEGNLIWVDISLRRVSVHGTERVLAVVRDITESKRTEEYLQRLNRTLKILLKCNEALIRAEDEQDLLNGICRIIKEDARYGLVRAGLVDGDEVEVFRLVAQSESLDDCSEILDVTWSEIINDGETCVSAADQCVPYLIKRNRINPDGQSIPRHEEYGYVPTLSVPLINGSDVLGVLTVEAAEPDVFDDEELNLMIRLSGDLAFGIKSLRAAAERMRMEKSLAKSKDNLAEAQSIAHLGSWEFDLETNEEYRSDEFFRILGLPPRGNGRSKDSVFNYINPLDHDHVRKCLTETLEGGKPYDVEYRIIRTDGAERIVHARGLPQRNENGNISRFIGTVLDVTERKKLEQKYLQAQKMEAVGQLAGGIAHDFNNILTAIIGYQHLLLERLKDEKSRNYADQVTRLAEKAANLTGNLLAFSRKQPLNPKPVDLNDSVRNVWKILKRLIGEDIEFSVSMLEGNLNIMAVASQLEQIIMNLATNARDAMPDGGVLSVTTESAEINDNYVLANGNGMPGKYAVISVSDTGTGMDEETKKRIFEPFFTTKEVGKGTGLGLSTVLGIVRHHGGYINVDSEPGEGTTFRIFLPLMENGVWVENHKTDIVPAKGSETVLLAEDDPHIREVMCSLLEGNGYNVISAVDGDQALEKYSSYGADIDLLILDVIMPKKNGKEVYDIISKTAKNVRAVFISGYSEDMMESKGIPDICHLVSKPFSPFALLAKIREVLDL